MSSDETFNAVGVVDFDHWQDPKDFTYHPRPMRPHDIQVKIIACGICGSDMHCAKGDWGSDKFVLLKFSFIELCYLCYILIYNVSSDNLSLSILKCFVSNIYL